MRSSGCRRKYSGPSRTKAYSFGAQCCAGGTAGRDGQSLGHRGGTVANNSLQCPRDSSPGARGSSPSLQNDSSTYFGGFGWGPLPTTLRSHFTTTSHGIRAYVPTGSFDDSPIAVLACATGAEDEDNVIGLVLRASGDRYRVGHDDGELGRWRTFEIPVTSYAFIAKRIMLKRTMTDVTIIHRASPHLTGGMPRPLLASWPRCEIALAPWTFYAILDQGFRLYLLTTMDHGPLQGAVESALPESAFIPVSEPPRVKLSQLTGSFAVLRLTHPTLTYAIDILLKPCSAPFHPPGGDSETIHLYAIYTWPPKTGSEPLPESSPQLRSPATSSLAASGLVSRRASEPCPGAQETGRCPLRTFTGSKKLADPKVSTWAIHTRSERIASGDIITYILGIRMRQMTEAELAEVRTPPSSDGAGASPAPSHIKPPVDEDKSRAGESNQVGSTDGAQPPAGKEDDKKPEDGSPPIQRRGMLGRISRLLKR
ncbi:hypothetical protein C8T65DRAFT_41044 [Cerioporus squamosus]|nr:hypothetical protein C8T65DRAFT_41044 [Cerioporus squamosus]